SWASSLASLLPGLCDNQLCQLPSSLGQLSSACRLSTLSLRNNPLVTKFAREFGSNWSVPSLSELSGRCVRSAQLHYCRRCLPGNLCDYLDSARECLNPNCKGVYFSSCVETVRFVDFCGNIGCRFCGSSARQTQQRQLRSNSSDDSASEEASGDDVARVAQTDMSAEDSEPPPPPAPASAAGAAVDDWPDEISARTDEVDSLASDDPGGANDLTVTPAELIDELLTACGDDLVDCVRDQLEGMDRQVRLPGGRPTKDLAGYLHRLELSRIRRFRLWSPLLRVQVRDHRPAAHAAGQDPVLCGVHDGRPNGGRWAGRLSKPEADFAKTYVTSMHRHFDSLVLNKVPQFLRHRPTELEAPRPNLDAFVFFRDDNGADGSASATTAVASVKPAAEAAEVELPAGLKQAKNSSGRTSLGHNVPDAEACAAERQGRPAKPTTRQKRLSMIPLVRAVACTRTHQRPQTECPVALGDADRAIEESSIRAGAKGRQSEIFNSMTMLTPSSHSLELSDATHGSICVRFSPRPDVHFLTHETSSMKDAKAFIDAQWPVRHILLQLATLFCATGSRVLSAPTATAGSVGVRVLSNLLNVVLQATLVQVQALSKSLHWPILDTTGAPSDRRREFREADVDARCSRRRHRVPKTG
uniref:PARP n=1 Tax=Macrostomum lignano TaxID=282301 RepID=A0A1I8JQU2_9PLAT